VISADSIVSYLKGHKEAVKFSDIARSQHIRDRHGKDALAEVLKSIPGIQKRRSGKYQWAPTEAKPEKKVRPGVEANQNIAKRKGTAPPKHITANVGLITKEKGVLYFEPVRNSAIRIPVASSSIACKDGDVVVAEAMTKTGGNIRIAKLIGNRNEPDIITRLTLAEHNLRTEFSEAAMTRVGELLAEGAPKPDEFWHDETDTPYLTVDPLHARDRDDAIWAAPQLEEDGTRHIKVAIFDVTRYVHSGDALDTDARQRGTSVYFPDRAEPMYPHEVSSDLFSLQANQNRAAMIYDMWVDGDGNVVREADPRRAIIKVAANLTYEEFQAARDGQPNEKTAPHIEGINAIFEAYKALAKARDVRGTLDLDTPKSSMAFESSGLSIKAEKVMDAHRAIEEFMLAANQMAIHKIKEKGLSAIFRVHADPPDPEKLLELRDLLKMYGLNAGGDLTTIEGLREVLDQSKVLPPGPRQVLSETILPMLARAFYSTRNIGHYGLQMDEYTHATSPIRRYPDNIVERLLVTAYNLGPGGMTPEEMAMLDQIALESTETEYAADMAERDAEKRYAADHLSKHIGQTYSGIITDVSGRGLTVRLDGSNIETFLPVRLLSIQQLATDKTGMILESRKGEESYFKGSGINVYIAESETFGRGIIVGLAGRENLNSPAAQTRPAPRL